MSHWKYPQWCAAIGVCLLLVQVGFLCGWASPYLSYLTKPNKDFQITTQEASWVASLLNAGRFFGAFLGVTSLHYCGSRKAVFTCYVPIAIGWVLIYLADGVMWLYASRSLSGVGMGMVFSCFPLYVGEVSLPEARGSMIMFAFCGAASGVFVASLCGHFLDMQDSNFAFLGPCLLGMAVFMLLPDSPHWLLKHYGDEEAAIRSISWYRSNEGVNEELASVRKYITSVKSKNFWEKLARFRNPPVRRALFITIVLFLYMQICGLNTIIFYMETIFHSAKSYLVEPSMTVALINLAGAVTIMSTVNLIDVFGRRTMLLVSGVGSILSNFSLGLHFQLMEMGYDARDFQWLPVVSIFFFLMFYDLGLLTVPSTVLSELFAVNVKNTAACLASLTGAVGAFAATKAFQPVWDTYGIQYNFFGYAVVMLSVIPFVLCCMPETKGKTLQELQEELMGR